MAVIGIMDSGMGGLSVLKEVRKLLPCERYIYYADNAFCPYGEKPVELIRQRSFEIVQILIEQGAELVIIACNTATSAAVKSLRESFSIPIIGIEPAVKPAAQSTRSGVVGVLATHSTLHSTKYAATRDMYKGELRFIEQVGQGFVELVERGCLTGSEAEAVVAASLQPILDAGADKIVLGCTHYPFLVDTMRKLSGPNVSFINPAPAVAKQVLKVLEHSGISYGNSAPSSVTLLASGELAALKSFYDACVVSG